MLVLVIHNQGLGTNGQSHNFHFSEAELEGPRAALSYPNSDGFSRWHSRCIGNKIIAVRSSQLILYTFMFILSRAIEKLHLFFTDPILKHVSSPHSEMHQERAVLFLQFSSRDVAVTAFLLYKEVISHAPSTKLKISSRHWRGITWYLQGYPRLYRDVGLISLSIQRKTWSTLDRRYSWTRRTSPVLPP